MTRLWLCLAVLATTACNGNDFTPVSRLDRLRVLALRAEPVNPKQGEATTVTPLVYTTATQDAAASSYAWTWCPILGVSADGYTCPFNDTQVQQLAAGLGATEAAPALDLGHAATASYKNVFPAAALAKLCTDGFGDFKPDCENGFPIRVKVTVVNGDETVVATAILRLPTDESVPSNQNPPIAGVEALLGDTPQMIDDTGSVVLPRLVDTTLRAKVDTAASEPYMGLDDNNQPAQVNERLVLSWFSEQGDLSNTQTAYVAGKSQFDRLTDNKIQPKTKADDPQDSARVIVVLRDNRGGVTWTEGVVKLGALP